MVPELLSVVLVVRLDLEDVLVLQTPYHFQPIFLLDLLVELEEVLVQTLIAALNTGFVVMVMHGAAQDVKTLLECVVSMLLLPLLMVLVDLMLIMVVASNVFLVLSVLVARPLIGVEVLQLIVEPVVKPTMVRVMLYDQCQPMQSYNLVKHLLCLDRQPSMNSSQLFNLLVLLLAVLI